MADDIVDTEKLVNEALDDGKPEDTGKAEETKETKVEEPKPTGEETKTEDTKETKVEPDGKPETKAATDDSAADKQQSRLGYQLRQIRANDPYISKVRQGLQDDYVAADGLTDEQRSIRRLESDQYVKDLETSRARLVSDNNTVNQEIPIFNPNSEEFNKTLYERSLARYSRDNLELDPQGEITGFKTPLLDFMREEADSYLVLVDKKKPEDKKPAPDSNAKMDAASEDAGGASASVPTQDEKDPIMAAFVKGFDSMK